MSSISVGLPFTMMILAPAPFAMGTTLAMGNTASVDPMASNRSQLSAASYERSMSSTIRFWPKLMVADLRMPPHS